VLYYTDSLLDIGETMPVKVIDLQIVGDGSRGAVTIESDLQSFPLQIEELTSASARSFVLAEATKAGIKGLLGISRTVDAPYPVNNKGETIENLTDKNGDPLPPQSPRMQPQAYRARYEVTGRQ
jgi:hypothetical protein